MSQRSRGAPYWLLLPLSMLCSIMGGALAGRLFTPAPAVAQQAPLVVPAQAFILVDRDGRARAGLSLLPGGESGLAFLDEDGEPRALLGFGAGGATGLALLDRDGNPRAVLALAPDGAPALVLSDKGGKAGAGLGLQTDGTPRLVLGELELP